MDFSFYIFLSTTIIYSFIILSVFKLHLIIINLGVADKKIVKGKLLMSLFAAILVAITFSQTAHLLRQYSAGALFFYAVVLFQQKKIRKSYLFMFSAILIHNSVLIPCVIFYLTSCFIGKGRSILSNLFLLFFVIIILGFGINTVIIEKFPQFLVIDNGSIPTSLFVSDLAILFAFLILCKGYSKTMPVLFYAPFGYLGFLLAIYQYDFIFLRFYFFWDFFRVLIFCMIIHRFNDRSSSVLSISNLPVFLCIIFFTFRYYSGGWSYELFGAELLTFSVLHLL
jgi:hypothetical protein